MIKELLNFKTSIMEKYGSNQHGAISSITVTPECWNRLLVDFAQNNIMIKDEEIRLNKMNIYGIDIKKG